MVVSQGDIFYVDFNPGLGHEQKNKRPALALSHDLVAHFGGLTIVAPISSTTRNYPTYHPIKNNKEDTRKGDVGSNYSVGFKSSIRYTD